MELKDRSDFTSHALSLIQGDRAKDYGDALENHKKIAEIWSVILDKKITPSQVVACMVGLKLARLGNKQCFYHNDTWTDIIGYGALGGEISQNEAE